MLADNGFWSLLGGSGDSVSSYFLDFGLISTITPTRIPFKVLTSLLIVQFYKVPRPSKHDLGTRAEMLAEESGVSLLMI